MADSSLSVSIIGEMITPALLILASGSLLATVLARLGRVVDYFRKFADALETHQAPSPQLAERHKETLKLLKKRASIAESSVTAFYGAVTIFVSTCLFIAVDRWMGHRISWLPITGAILGSICLLTGSGLMVSECHLAVQQLHMELDDAFRSLDKAV